MASAERGGSRRGLGWIVASLVLLACALTSVRAVGLARDRGSSRGTRVAMTQLAAASLAVRVEAGSMAKFGRPSGSMLSHPFSTLPVAEEHWNRGSIERLTSLVEAEPLDRCEAILVDEGRRIRVELNVADTLFAEDQGVALMEAVEVEGSRGWVGHDLFSYWLDDASVLPAWWMGSFGVLIVALRRRWALPLALTAALAVQLGSFALDDVERDAAMTGWMEERAKNLAQVGAWSGDVDAWMARRCETAALRVEARNTEAPDSRVSGGAQFDAPIEMVAHGVAVSVDPGPVEAWRARWRWIGLGLALGWIAAAFALAWRMPQAPPRGTKRSSSG